MVHWYWLRRMVRRSTTPIPVPFAEKWQKRLTFLYLFFSWNAFGFVTYYIFTGRKDWAQYYGLKTEEDMARPVAVQWAGVLGINRAHVIRMSGMTKTGEYEIEDGQQKIEGEKEELIE